MRTLIVQMLKFEMEMRAREVLKKEVDVKDSIE
jgi:hypothetical protein